MKTKIVSISLLILMAYLLFFPVKIKPRKYTSLPIPELIDQYILNDKLSSVDILFKNQCPQCEDIAIDSKGNLYGGTEDGRILKFTDNVITTLADTKGRPLGLYFDDLDNLIVCDAQKGLLSITPNGQISVLATEHDGIPFKFTDDVDISKEGIIYFSDASYKFDNESYKLDFIEHGPNGRLLSYNPSSKETTLLLDNLYFANGVALSEDDSFVLVNETSNQQVRRYWLKGDKAGSSDLLIENLPFYPDGISRGSFGVFWIAMQSPRKKIMDVFSNRPFIRKMIVRLPSFFLPKPKNYGFVLGVNKEGKIIYNLQDPNAKFAQITNVLQKGKYLYLGSLSENGIGRYKLD